MSTLPWQNFFGTVSFFAINIVRKELKRARENAGNAGNAIAEKKNSCNCKAKMNYKLPCQHMLALVRNGTIDIHLIPQRWYLNYAEDTSTIAGEIQQNTLTLLQCIQNAVENAENNFKKIEIIETINNALDSLKEVPLEDVKLPHVMKQKGRPETTSGKRIESGFETEKRQICKGSQKDDTSFDSNAYVLPGK
ncbi:hypothetical protein EC973_007589 [Apophysomyces ossiformis]|uniref:SWIM-type domain-containing protein n=1 Tax=Apophysomyces ossiformis TaxID=679940 RepID=A0A8H7ERK7_9FUNG|nr:hypothetical protein EC973_007589 [Apophysomyces ossiformis]